MKVLKNGKATVSIILAVLISFMLPVEVFAQATPKNNPSAKVKFNSLAEAEDMGNIVTELKGRRDKYTKHFRMDDGTIMAVSYDYPVHYKNDKGKWIEYNNTLAAETEATPDELSEPEYYTNKKSNIDVDIPSNSKSNQPLRINSKNGTISWRYLGQNESKIKIPKEKKKNKPKDKTTVDKLTSTVSYNSVYKDVNLDCIISSIGVKENLVLQNKTAQNEFEIEYDVKGYKVKKVDERTITLNKKGKSIYTISAPCMYDSDNKFSNNLSFNILSEKEGKLRVKLEADKEFLNDKKTKYPVTIDPEVVISGYYRFCATHVLDSQPDTALTEFYNVNIGNTSNGNYYGLVKLRDSQYLYSNKQIVSAKLNITTTTSNDTGETEIEAYPVTTSWTTATATYNNISYSPDVIDYSTIAQGYTGEVTFDITKIFKKWSENTHVNQGVLFKSNSFVSFAGEAYYVSTAPKIIVKYKDYTGLESNLTSHSVPCGQDAVFSVCDYTGSLSVKQMFFEESTARLPLSIYAIYHSVRSNSTEETGYGWFYSFNQSITEDDNYYIYNDADGVDHYFKKEGEEITELSDEDDLGYTLKKCEGNSNKLYIDNDSITQTFEIVDNTDVYKLKSEKSNDNENNTINYTYNNAGYVNSITTSLGDYTIVRDNDNNILRIHTPSGKNMYYVYYSGSTRIARFTAVDGKATHFYYVANGNDVLIDRVHYANDSILAGKIGCEYYSNNKVKKITEYGKNGASRKFLSITYNDDNTTEFKERENNDKTELYTFDNYGNTVSVLNANGMITNMSDSGSLSVNTGADSYTKNYIDNSNSPDTNYFVPGITSLGNYDVSQGSVSVDNSNSYMNSSSLKIHNESGNQIGTIAAHNFSATGFNGKNITLSAYIKTTNISKIHNDFSFGAYVSIRCSAGGGTNAQVCSDSVSVTKTINGWDRVSATLEVPQNADTVTVILGLKNTYGTAWFDCLQLEKGNVMNDYNALSNSDFASTSNWKNQDDSAVTINNDNNAEISGNGGEPASTEETTSNEPDPTSSTEEPTLATYTSTETETVENDVIEETNSHGNVIKTEQGFVTRTYKRTYGPTEPEETSSSPEGTSSDPENSGDETNEPQTINCNKYIYQEVDVHKKDVSFVLTGTAKAKSVPLNSEYRTFGIALKIMYENDSEYTEEHYQEFNAYTDAKQSVSLSVTPNNLEKEVEKVAFAFVYGYNKNKMTVYNAMLNYSYNGAAEEQPETTETTEPESTSPTEETTAPTEPDSTAEENEDNLIDEEITSEEINTDEDYMRSEKTYDNNGNYITSEIDEAGNTTTYTNDSDGNVTKIKDGENNETSYSYDVHNNLTSVSSGNSSNTYTYNEYNELSKITHNGFDYNYTYTHFGEPASVKVGSQALATYHYTDYGLLARTTYGNGDYLEYTYDDYARITKVELNNTTTLATYIYNKKGQVTKFIDGKSGETTEYCYDCNGNALYKYLISSDGELLRVVNGETEKTTVNGSMRTITNGTDDDGKSYVQNGKAKITSDTDDFGRTSKVTTSIKDEDDFVDKFNLTYSYKNVGETNRTTSNVHEMTYKIGEGENATQIAKYKYSYDSNGNITDVWENNVKIAEYEYDSLNQLKECADKTADKYFVYNYDNNGNITSIDIHSLVNGLGKGAKERTDSYSYSSSGWKDQLVSYKNDSITYDNIGNPTSYRDGMTMSWTGRELQSITKNSNTYSFTYNLNGLRTKKNINGTNTFYYYDDSNNLIGLKKGNTTVLFYYDSEGSLYSMSKGNDTYFLIKNLQGDVTKIIDEDGETCATYAYDAWGALLAENEDSSVEGLNPFRYKGYVYDTETELYYLQSRYYDPKTGRFINADSPEYTDTGSGTPLSTNMFAYCENNAPNEEDPSGYWNKEESKKKGHPTLVKNLPPTVQKWVIKADSEFKNRNDKVDGYINEQYCSEPFHSRKNALTIFKNIYNKAIKVKKGSGKVTFEFTKDKKKRDVKKLLYYKFFGAQLKNIDKKLFTKDNDMSKKLKTMLNNLGSKDEQADALLGLALHTIQDYYAHRIIVCYYKVKEPVAVSNEKNRKNKFRMGTIINKSVTRFNKDIRVYGKKISTDQLEDNPDFISWRFCEAQRITNFVYNLYKSKSEITNVYSTKLYQMSQKYYITYSGEPKFYLSNPGGRYVYQYIVYSYYTNVTIY